MSWPFTLQHPHLVNFVTKSTHAVHDTIGFLFWLAQGKYSWSAARHQGDVGSTTEHSLFDFLDKWFAFDGNVDNPYLPHNHIKNSVVYTGTHDNDTTLGWFEELPQRNKEYIDRYLGYSDEPMPWALIECAFRSVADWAIVPMQDLLSLGKGHRMNTPGVKDGNWRWRFQWSQMHENLASKLSNMITQFERNVI